MKNKVMIWSSVILLIVIMLIGGIWLVNNQNDNSKEKVDPIIEVITKQNQSVKAKNLDIQKEKEDGKYKVIDKSQSSERNTVYYLVDPATNKVQRFNVFKVQPGSPNK